MAGARIDYVGAVNGTADASPPRRVPDDVLAFYGSGVEDERLTVGEGALEFERTKELIERFLPSASRVADIGGAVGRYAEWLAAAGHRVDLVDPAPGHDVAARERAGEPPRFDVHLGEAGALPLDDAAYDGVLLLGPLYHLGDREDRIAALREAARICRPAGVVFAVAISRFAPVTGVISREAITDARVFANVQAETLTGRRVEPAQRVSPFPDSYFHLPEELADEVVEAGFRLEGVYGVEGLGRFLPNLPEHWQDEAMRERLLTIARSLETDPHVLSLSAHVLAVAHKP